MSSTRNATTLAIEDPALITTLGAFWSLLKGANTAIDVLTMGRKLGASGVIFKAGVAVGAGVGMLLAPRSVAEIRRRILQRIGLARPARTDERTPPAVEAQAAPESRAAERAEEIDDPVTLPAPRAPRAKASGGKSESVKPVR
jgi:hypothetical protein